MNDPESFSFGADAFLRRLSPSSKKDAAGERGFPATVKDRRNELRFQKDESVHAWFKRCAKEFMPDRDGGVERWRLEEDLAAFASVAWQDGELTHAAVNVLLTRGGSLLDYLEFTEDELNGEYREVFQALYLRLDLDYGTLGPIGTHPFPHIHFSPGDSLRLDEGPRFAMSAGGSTNVVVDFLDFIYRHYFHKKWLEWALRAWFAHGSTDWGRTDPLARFKSIENAYQESAIKDLRARRDDVERLARALATAKDELYSLRLNADDRRLACFPDLPT